MIHTNDDIADLIQDTIQLMQKINTFVDTENDHDCDYRNIYRTHKLMVTSFLQKLNELTNEKVSIEHINPRDLMQTLEELKHSLRVGLKGLLVSVCINQYQWER